WPGNVSEMKNVIERSLLLNNLPSSSLPGRAIETVQNSGEEADGLLLEAVEKRHILRVLDQQSGNKSAAARILGISRKTLERKVQAWGLD
ncbi:MAG: helix-turn-helix domain-containing protein, partial [Candidatus Thiodiazotropha sp.]